jgi:hypothetical protein
MEQTEISQGSAAKLMKKLEILGKSDFYMRTK